MINKVLKVLRRYLPPVIAIKKIRKGTESAPTPAGRVLNDWSTDVEEKQERTLSNEEHAEETRLICDIPCG